ncbi:ABC transporter substrate-binding protein [Aquitalea sp. LB_tupeE]|uniref:substrate-binding periplasmic protein n=1 Tax=Aquitalea sp. LB_tupeE TaxID=2748078 RepID=UPI001C4C077D|nr:transporter substrate-binding domain-containing protein [Aquitalea sp. LB_tupeE]
MLLPPSYAAGLTAYTEELPPLNYLQGQQVSGFASDLLTAMASKAGLALRLQLLPWSRAYATVQTTPDTMLFSTVRTPERENQFRWVGPIGKRHIYLYRLSKREDIRLTDIRQLGQWRIGTIFASASQKQLEQLGLRPGIEQDNAPDDASNLAKLSMGRVDMVAMLDWAMHWQLRQSGMPDQQIRPVALLDGQAQYWFALNWQTPDATIRQLQNALDALARNGELKRLRQKYIGTEDFPGELADFGAQLRQDGPLLLRDSDKPSAPCPEPGLGSGWRHRHRAGPEGICPLKPGY